jgi:hypothetical protein
LDIKVFKKKCALNANCKINSTKSGFNSELKLAILKKAAKFAKEKKTETKREYKVMEVPDIQ